MEQLIKNPQAKWYLDLSSRFEELVSNLEIDDDQASELKIFVLQVAKDQYLAGNRSGIKWARSQSAGTPMNLMTIA